MNKLILTVQSNGTNGWRLGINENDSQNIFKCRKVKVLLHLSDNLVIESYTACGNPCDDNGKWLSVNKNGKLFRKKGYDLNKKELSSWLSKKFKNEIKGSPKKLIFNYEKIIEVYHLYFDSEKLNNKSS